MKKLNLLLGMLVLITASFAQSTGTKFINFRNSKSVDNNNKVVYFLLDNVGGTEQAVKIQSDLENDANITSCQIVADKDGRYACKVIMKQNIKPENIRGIILSSGADFNPDSVVPEENNIRKSSSFDPKKRADGMPEHYPVFIDTGNPDHDNSVYDQAKQEWIKNYPEEVEQITGRSYQNSTGLVNPDNAKLKK